MKKLGEGIAKEKLSIPSFRGFSLFRVQIPKDDVKYEYLSIPSFRGFSLFRDGGSDNDSNNDSFQSPVLGVFLCFLLSSTLWLP